MNQPIDITNWSINASGDEYDAPETRVAILRGNINWHPTLKVTPTDNVVRTSQIRGWEGPFVRTNNSVYNLVGEPDPVFISWMREKGLDTTNPLKSLADAGYLPQEG